MAHSQALFTGVANDAQGDEWQHIALLIGRTPHQAAQYLAHRHFPERMTRLWDNLPWAPRWSWQHPLLRNILKLPYAQRLAVAQMVYARVLGSVSHTYALLQALRTLASTLSPPIRSEVFWVPAAAYQCQRAQVYLANGEFQRMAGHVRQCRRCRVSAEAFQRIRQAVTVVLASATYPPLPHVAPMSFARTVLWWVPLLLVVVCLIVMRIVPSTPTVMSGVDADQLFAQAQAHIYDIPTLDAGEEYLVQTRVFWRFADGSASVLNARLWYQQSPEQYRTELVHVAGGNPYELDVVTPYQRLYHITDIYLASTWPYQRPAATVLLETPPFGVRETLRWRLRQGAWQVAHTLLIRGMNAPEKTVIGVALGAESRSLLRIRTVDEAGELWFDIDPARGGHLDTIWRVTASAPQMLWQLVTERRQQASTAKHYGVIQPAVGEAERRGTASIHPALPLIAPAQGRTDGEQVEFQDENRRCRVILQESLVWDCREMVGK